MAMKNLPHPGEMIGDILAELDISISQAAKNLGISRQQLHNVISGRSVISPELAVRLEKALGSSADAWLKMQANFDLVKARQNLGALKVRPFIVPAA